MSKISITTLGSLIEFQRGYDLPKTSFVEGDVPVISSNGILGYHNEYKVKGPGITIGRSGTVGLPHYIEENFYPHNTSLFIKDFKGNNPKYIYYLLKTLGLNDRGSGSGVPTMNRNHLHPLKVRAYLNPIYQEGIANVLTSIDSKIALNNRINAELEAMAKTVYDYWFVQFDFPFDFAQGKPNASGKPYKSSGGKMVWSEELKREVPEGWEVKPLDKIIETIIDNRGKTPLKLGGDWAQDRNGVVALSAKHVKGGKLIKLDEANVVTFEMFEKWMSSNKLREGDILMTSEAPCGEFYLILIDTNYCLSQRLFAIRANQSIIKSSYLYYELSKGNGFSQILGKQSGSTVFGIRQNELRTVNILIPDFKLQEIFDIKIAPMLYQIRNNELLNQQLSSLRDWLLPMLMNGQVKVGEVEEEVKTLMAAEVTPTYKLPALSNIPDNKRGFAKQVLGGKIVKEFKDDKNFTHIKFQKLQYLAEQIIEENLNWNYYRQSAGPYDNKFMHSVFNRLEKNSWFRKRGDNYYPLEKMNDIDKYYQNYFGNKSEKLNNLFGLLQRGTEKFCEAVATIYAVWNNHIILKQEFDKERVKADFFDWSNRKTAVFTEEEFEKALFWMQNHDIVPTGFGGLIKEKK
jgi:type I restriction enzyme S subunit